MEDLNSLTHSISLIFAFNNYNLQVHIGNMNEEIGFHRSKRTFSNYKKMNSNLYSPSTKASSRPTITKKSVQCPKNISRSPRKPNIIPRAQKKNFNLSQTLQKQRQRELQQMKKSVALLKYYNCMLMLFMMLYTSSQILMSNMFEVQHKSYPQFGVKFIDSLLKVYQGYQKKQNNEKLKRLAINVMRMSPTPNDFEKRAEFISRKVTLNYQKKKEIQMAELNNEVNTFWQKVYKMLYLNKSSHFAVDMFDSNAQKLCVKDFQELIAMYLSSSLFETRWKEAELLNTQGNPDVHDFTIQFLLIEKVCTKQFGKECEGVPSLKEVREAKKYCQIY